MTITKIGEDSLLISLLGQDDVLRTHDTPLDCEKIRMPARSIVVMLALPWLDFGLDVYASDTKLLVFVVCKHERRPDVFAFHRLDDMLDACTSVPCLRDASLYRVDETYYLIADARGPALAALLEFSLFDRCLPSKSYIREHGEKLLDIPSINRQPHAPGTSC